MRAVIRSPITLRVNKLDIFKRMICDNVNITYPTQHSILPNHLQEIFVMKLKILSFTPKCRQVFMHGDRSTWGLILF